MQSKSAKSEAEWRKELSKSNLVGCYYCLSIYKPDLVWEWVHAANKEVFPMCPFCRIDSVIGDGSGRAMTKDFLCEMNKRWFEGDGESINADIMYIFTRYDGKILGIRNYDSEKEMFVATDFINLGCLYDFLWEVDTRESDLTPAGVVFLQEYFDLESLAREYKEKNKKLPSDGKGKTKEEQVALFVRYIKDITPLETASFIAEAQRNKNNKGNKNFSVDNLDQKFLPPGH